VADAILLITEIHGAVNAVIQTRHRALNTAIERRTDLCSIAENAIVASTVFRKKGASDVGITYIESTRDFIVAIGCRICAISIQTDPNGIA